MEVVQRVQLQDFAADLDSGGLVGVSQQGVVFGTVEEGALRGYEVGREEDVGAESGEESIEFGGAGWREGWEGAYE